MKQSGSKPKRVIDINRSKKRVLLLFETAGGCCGCCVAEVGGLDGALCLTGS